MGNTASMQHDANGESHLMDINHRLKRLQEYERGRQQSITSQLFPSRNTRHSPIHNSNKLKIHSHKRPEIPVFKTNYSMEDPVQKKANSTESIRDDMAGLSLKNSNDQGTETPPFLSPGPSSSTVQPTRQEAVSVNDLGGHSKTVEEFDYNNAGFPKIHRPSVVALMKSLNEDRDTARSSLKNSTRSPSTDIYGALSLGSQDNDDDKSMGSRNDMDDGYLQSEDVVLNQSLLHNALKKDMKRKRSNHQSGKKNNISTNTSHEARLKVSNNSFSYESFDSAATPELKKPKSLSIDNRLLPSFQPTKTRKESVSVPHSPSLPPSNPGDANFDRIDSFEKKFVEHREGVEISSPSFSSDSSDDSEKVNVILKFRDAINDSPNKVSVLSADILSALDSYSSSNSNGLPMKYDESDRSWYVPHLLLPPGIYKFQFLIDGLVRHSNFLPTATDSVGSIVNWFEVLPGYETIEPYRDQIDPNSIQNDKNEKIVKEPLTKNNSSPVPDRRSQGTLIAQPVPGRPVRPQLINRRTSSHCNRPDRAGTPYSDYAGISRTSSALRKSPMGSRTVSSMDLVTALQPKKYEYSSEIPEIFKAGNQLNSNNENMTETQNTAGLGSLSHEIAPTGLPTYEEANACKNIVDCDQDTLFARLQQGGLIDAEAAEQEFLQQYNVPDLPIYLNSTYLNKTFNLFQNDSHNGASSGVNHIIPHVNLNHLLTSSIRDEMICVGCTTRYEGKFITQVIYAPCYYASGTGEN